MKTAAALILATLGAGAVVTSAAAQQNPVKATAESVQAGKALFEQNCAICHGHDGKGDGPAAAALNPKPADLASGQFKHGGSDAEIFNTVTRGVPGTPMVAWTSIPERDRWNLVNYIKSLSARK